MVSAWCPSFTNSFLGQSQMRGGASLNIKMTYSDFTIPLHASTHTQCAEIREP